MASTKEFLKLFVDSNKKEVTTTCIASDFVLMLERWESWQGLTFDLAFYNDEAKTDVESGYIQGSVIFYKNSVSKESIEISYKLYLYNGLLTLRK